MIYRIIAVLAVTAGLGSAAIPTGYVSYWPMDGALTDAGTSNDGTSSDSAGAVFVSGVKGQALKLNGSNSVNVGNDASLDFSGSFSIGGWVYLYSRGSYHAMVNKSTWNSGFYIRQGGSYPGYWEFAWEDLEKTSDPQDVSKQTDSWVHIMGVYDGAVMYQYRDGVLVDTTVSDGMAPTTASMKIGTVNGLLDEIIYYDRALSAAEVGELMTSTRDTTPPVIWDIRAVSLPAYSAMISWKTDIIATGEVEYGIDTSYYSVLWDELDTVHNLQINGLVEGEEYYYRVRSMNSLGYLTVSPWCTLAVPQPGPTQRFSINDGVDRSGKPIPADRVWPAGVGDADVCFWADDKLAAFNFNIDDNPLHERDWWISMARKHGFQVTWNLIVGRLYENHSYFGNFNTWKVAVDSGMDMASHSYHHGCAECAGDYYYGCDYEYSEPVSAMMREWGIRPLCFAAPGQSVFENDGFIRRKYYIGGRIGAGGSHQTTTEGANRSTVYALARTVATDGKRGCGTQYFHQAAGNTLPQATQDSIFAVWDSLFGAIREDFGDDLWWWGSTGIAQYVNSRETHTLSVDAVTDSMIAFTLKDSMLDELYNFPLTVKVRISNDWDTCIAMQGSDAVEAAVVTHDGDKYALVKAVPDRGQVVLSTDGKTSVMSNVKCRMTNAPRPARYYSLSGAVLGSGPQQRSGVYLKVENGIVRKVMVLE